MTDPESIRDAAGIVNVLAGTAGTVAGGEGAMIVELKRNANDLMPGFVQQASDDAAVHASGHCHDDTHVQPIALRVAAGSLTTSPSSASVITI